MPFPFTPQPDPKRPVRWTPDSEQGVHPVGDAILGASDAIRGLAGLGGDSTGSKVGELVGAGLPFIGPLSKVKPVEDMVLDTEHLSGPVKALVEMLGQKPAPMDADQIALGSRITGRAYHQPEFKVPKVVDRDTSVPDAYTPGFVVDRKGRLAGVKFEMPAGVEPAKPRNFQEASQYDRGFVPGFGQSAGNLEASEPWADYYKQIYPTKSQPKGPSNMTTIQTRTDMGMRDVAPAIKGLQELGDVQGKPPVIAEGRKPISGYNRTGIGRRSKLSEEQVKAIRSSTVPIGDAAAQFDVDESTVRAIRKRESFNWVKD